jgi:hypothetical protein
MALQKASEPLPDFRVAQGPADKAGIKRGDVIVSALEIAGVVLLRPAREDLNHFIPSSSCASSLIPLSARISTRCSSKEAKSKTSMCSFV